MWIARRSVDLTRCKESPMPRIIRIGSYVASFVLILACVFLDQAFGQLPINRLTALAPSAVTAGKENVVVISGSDLDGANALLFSHAGITARQSMTVATEATPAAPVANSFVVSVAPDVPPGVYEVRSVGRFGVSNPRLITVSPYSVASETGPNKSREAAQAIPVDSVTCGVSDGNSKDYFAFDLKAGQRVLLDCFAERIDSSIDLTVEIIDPTGKVIVHSRDVVGRDPIADITAPADGTYAISVRDMLYRGGADYFYQLHLHTSPRVDFALPTVVNGRDKAMVTLYGRMLGGKPSAYVVGGVQLEALDVEFNPAEIVPGSLAYFSRPNAHNLPSVAWHPTINGKRSSGVPLLVSDLKSIVESVDNDVQEKSMPIEVGVAISGSFEKGLDDDWFELNMTKGQVVMLDLISQRLGADTDGLMLVHRVVVDQAGVATLVPVAEVDDPGDRAGNLAADIDLSSDDPTLRFQAPEDGKYRIRIQDQFADSNPNAYRRYVFVVRAESPTFELIARPAVGRIADANQAILASHVIRRGGTERLIVDVRRLEGFGGDVELSIEGLPQGVVCNPVVVSSFAPNATLILTAAEDAAVSSAPLKIVGKAKIGDADVVRTAAASTLIVGSGNRTQSSPRSRLTNEIRLTVVGNEVETVLATIGDGNPIVTSRGAKLDLPVVLARRNGFADAFKVAPVGLPGEIKSGEINFEAGKGEARAGFDLANAALKPGTYVVYFQGDLKFKYVRNPDSITAAEAKQKGLEAEIAASMAKKAEAMTAIEAATAQEGPAKTELAAAQQALAPIGKELADTAVLLSAGNINAANAATAAAANPADAALAAKASDEEAKLAAMENRLSELLAQKKAARDRIVAASAQVAAIEKQKTELTQQIAAIDAAIPQLTQAKTAADAAVEQAKKDNPAADLTYTSLSRPVQLIVEASPITVAASDLEVKAGESISLSVGVERKYGFAEAITVEAAPAAAVAGLTVEPATINPDQASGMPKIVTTAQTPPGTYDLVVKAKAKFNGVDVETAKTLKLKVN